MRILKILALTAILNFGPVQTLPAQTVPNGAGTVITSAGNGTNSRSVTVGVNRSVIIELEAPASDVVIANPEIADAVVQTSQRIIFRGVKYGQTSALIFDRGGRTLLDLSLFVETDMASLEDTIRRHVPEARVKLESLNGSIVMTGSVDSLSQSENVRQLVAAYFPTAGADDGPKIVNMLNILAPDQVLLEVRIVEMQRNIVKQLGINLSGMPSWGNFESALLSPPLSTAGEITSNLGFPIQGRSLGGIGAEVDYTNFNGNTLQSRAGAAINALERIGVVKTLAEPNMVAMSGESAKFLAGGEFPVPVGQDNQGRITVEFKPYGVGLGFTPVVLSEGRISLKVSTEVSELTSQGAFQGQRQTFVDEDGNVISVEGVTLPGLTVRRAESTIELPSGGSMMMAGLISSKDRQNLDQVPGLKKLPILGALFQSRDFISEESELVIIVTPYLVNSAGKTELRTPADGYANASDAKTIFFGKLNETYGRDGASVKAEEYRAPVGFLEE
ncbi:MAG: type II and III secretion system protein family protein [Hyphomonas sp.]|uniref:type II and III secretion system protein family protein n=1 Tax=Hyphomonas sp. TaxID=87 RepID=UPI0034A0271D